MLNSLQALPGYDENNHQHLLKASLFIKPPKLRFQGEIW